MPHFTHSMFYHGYDTVGGALFPFCLSGISFGEVAKLVGEAWKTVSGEDKAKYERMAAADKERYKREMANYKGPVDPEDDGFIVDDEEEGAAE